MILIVTKEDIERGGEGSFEVLRHVVTAGHTASSGPHVKVCLYSFEMVLFSVFVFSFSLSLFFLLCDFGVGCKVGD